MSQTIQYGWGEVPPWVFIDNKGNPLCSPKWQKEVLDKACEKAKLRRITHHVFRHTFASLLIQAGESLAYVKKQLGHSSIQITVDCYGHLVPGGNKGAVDRLEDDATNPQPIRNQKGGMSPN